MDVDTAMERLRSYQLPPQTLRELGLDDDWNQHIDRGFVALVLRIAGEHKDLLRELSRR